MDQLVAHADSINRLMTRYGVKFGIYANGEFNERLFPFDASPRIISADEWTELEAGLRQRVDALNLFLADIYGEKRILTDGIIPEDFVYSSSGYLAACEGISPHKDIYSHISGIDLVQARNGDWFVLEDNLRIPSGASYPLIARELCRRCSPDTFRGNHVIDNRSYVGLLRSTMDYVNKGGINVILTPGRYNAAYFEHSYLAEKTGAVLACGDDLFCENGFLWYRNYGGDPSKVGALYRRVSDEYLDPLVFEPDSLIGIPGLMSVYASGNVALLNAPGNGVADDKGIYYFVPKMVEYYLNETPILKNAPTYLPFYQEDKDYVLSNMENLVIKDVAEAGGYGVVFGSELSEEELQKLTDAIISEPRRFIAQEIVDFIELPVTTPDGSKGIRKADLRAFVLCGEKTEIWASGLTRYAFEEGSAVVNSSQGGGFKDTWVLSQ